MYFALTTDKIWGHDYSPIDMVIATIPLKGNLKLPHKDPYKLVLEKLQAEAYKLNGYDDFHNYTRVDAIVNVRFDSTTHSVTAYGTAIHFEH